MTEDGTTASHNTRDLGLLVGGNVVSTFGNAVYILAVTLLLKDLTQSALVLGVFQFLALSPGFLLSPLTGALIDRVSRRRVVILTDLYRGILMVATGLALTVPAMRTPTLILPVAFLAGIGHALFVPAAHALLPSLVPPERLQRATALRAASSQAANLGGNAVGGLIFALLGAPILFVINGASFLLSAFQETFIRGGRRAPTQKQGESLLTTARVGLSSTLRDTRMLVLMASQAGLFVVSPVVVLALPFIVIDELGLAEGALGYFFALALGGGIAAFAVLRNRPHGRMLSEPLIALSYLALGAGFSALAFHVGIVVLAVVAVVSGAAAATVYLYVTTYIQRRTPAELHGRFFAVLEAASAMVAPVSYLLVGALLEVAGPARRWSLFVAVGVMSLLWAAVLTLRRRRAESDETRNAVSR